MAIIEPNERIDREEYDAKKLYFNDLESLQELSQDTLDLLYDSALEFQDYGYAELVLSAKRS